MNKYTNEKYEYLLHTWGGFYNDEYKRQHCFQPGNYWFDTQEELDNYLKVLKDTEVQYNAKHLAYVIYKGKYVRYKTIAKMKMVLNGKEYPYEYDFGYGYPVHLAKFMFIDGNYGCDCNRSYFLKDRYPEIEELGCGDKIKLKNFKVERIKI